MAGMSDKPLDAADVTWPAASAIPRVAIVGGNVVDLMPDKPPTEEELADIREDIHERVQRLIAEVRRLRALVRDAYVGITDTEREEHKEYIEDELRERLKAEVDRLA
jgi:hypothetical protein